MWAAHCWWFFNNEDDFSNPKYPLFGVDVVDVQPGSFCAALTWAGQHRAWIYNGRLYVNT